MNTGGSGLRQRRKPVAQVITDFDAFPKVPETYVEQTAAGGYGKVELCVFSNLYELNMFFSVHYHLLPGDDAPLLGG